MSNRWGILVCAVALAAAGCSGSTMPPRHTVKGRVVMNESPVAEATVVFYPLAEQAQSFPKPLAQTDAKGEFALTTLTQADGAPAGEYAITVELREPRLVGEEYTRDGRHLLPERYADPASSGLRYKVIAGSNEVPP